MICKGCGKEFEGKRRTALYCSAKCKLAYHRTLDTLRDDTLTPETDDTLNRDNFDSPDYDLSEEGFARRNRDWEEFSVESRNSIMSDVRDYHSEWMSELAQDHEVLGAIREATTIKETEKEGQA